MSIHTDNETTKSLCNNIWHIR